MCDYNSFSVKPFSGDFLTGNGSGYVDELDCVTQRDLINNGRVQIYCLNKAGYIPVVSTFTGLARLMVGLAHMIYHFVKAIFDDKKFRYAHVCEAFSGFGHLIRGAIEMVPGIGNVLVLFLDYMRRCELASASPIDELNKGPITIDKNGNRTSRDENGNIRLHVEWGDDRIPKEPRTKKTSN